MFLHELKLIKSFVCLYVIWNNSVLYASDTEERNIEQTGVDRYNTALLNIRSLLLKTLMWDPDSPSSVCNNRVVAIDVELATWTEYYDPLSTP